MKNELIDRDYDYWEILRNLIQSTTVKTSKWLEPKLDWNKNSRMINPIIDISSKEIKACIGRLRGKDGFGLWISEEFLGWLDDAAVWMNKDAIFKKSLYTSTLAPNKDLSLWMHTNWISWVINHEFGHFICGHLSVENSSEWSEFDAMNGLSSDDIKKRVACEFDADIFAASTVFGGTYETLKDERLSTIGTKYFFDLGMIFCGIFIAMHHMNPAPKIHPNAIDRFMTFVHRGLGEFVLHTRKDAIVEYEAFINGAMKCIALLGKDGLNYGRKLKEFDINVLIETKKYLVSLGFNEKRKVELEKDWLSSDIPVFYRPTKKITLWDLEKYPD